MTRETKAQIAERTSFEDIYAEISKLKIKLAEFEVIERRISRDIGEVRSEINRWNGIASEKRKLLVNPQQH